jgi:hypothetical protein
VWQGRGAGSKGSHLATRVRGVHHQRTALHTAANPNAGMACSGMRVGAGGAVLTGCNAPDASTPALGLPATPGACACTTPGGASLEGAPADAKFSGQSGSCEGTPACDETTACSEKGTARKEMPACKKTAPSKEESTACRNSGGVALAASDMAHQWLAPATKPLLPPPTAVSDGVDMERAAGAGAGATMPRGADTARAEAKRAAVKIAAVGGARDA